MTDWTVDRKAKIAYSYERFAQAKIFVFRKWCDQAKDRGLLPPADLSGSCKYGSLFMNQSFSVARYTVIMNINTISSGGRIVDLSHDAIDVGRITNPYLHEPDYFAIPEKRASLNKCLPRVEGWVIEFLAEIERSEV